MIFEIHIFEEKNVYDIQGLHKMTDLSNQVTLNFYEIKLIENKTTG